MTRRWSRGAWLIALAVLLCLGIFYSRAARRVTLGKQFQYIPRESELVIATGGLESLWGGVDSLFRAALRSEGMKEAREGLLKAKFPIKRVKDLEKYGLDVSRGILISIYRPMTDLQFVAVVPIVGRQKALEGLLALDEGGAKPTTTWIGEHPVHHFDDLLVAFPEPDVAVVSGSEELLRRSLTLREENLAHASNNDALYRAVHHVARGPLFVGANVFVYWQGRTAPFDERAAILRLSRNEIRIEGEIELRDSTLSAMDAVRRRSKGTAEWVDKLPDGTFGLAVLQDEHLGQYRDVLAENVMSEIRKTWAETIHRWAPGMNPPRVQRVAVALTDIEDGLPDFLFGFWGERRELEAMLPVLQREFRRTRDMALLNGALEKYRREQKKAPPPSVSDLKNLRLLDPEEDSLFHRYPIEQGKVGTPAYRNEDFATQTYERNFHGHRIRFLAPPLGANDLAYRSDLSKADPKSLSSDRYRMATVLDRDVLWVATDVRDLETLLSPRKSKANAHAHRVALAAVPPGAKFRAALDLDRLMELSLLSPGSQFDKLTREMVDLQDFSALEIDVVPSLDESRLHFSASLSQRKEQ